MRIRLQTKSGCKEVQKADCTGMTALHFACSFRPPIDIVESLLLLHPASSKQPDIFGKTPLHEACENLASIDVIDFLLEHWPFSATLTDKRGRTPLHHAVHASCTHCSMDPNVIVKLSMIAPQTILAKDANGETPSDVGFRRGGRFAGTIAKFLSEIAAGCPELDNCEKNDKSVFAIYQTSQRTLYPRRCEPSFVPQGAFVSSSKFRLSHQSERVPTFF